MRSHTAMPAMGTEMYRLMENNSIALATPAKLAITLVRFTSTSSVITTPTLDISSIFTQSGTYDVTLYAVKGTCRDSVTKKIYVEIPSELIIPNVFTPNGDGENDVLFVRSNVIEGDLYFAVYNRWGQLVFESNDLLKAWDGKRDGVDQPVGTYIFELNAITIDDLPYQKHGDVNLLR